MDLVALIRLIAAHPDKAASIVLNLNKNGYYTEFKDYLNICHLLNINDEVITKNINEIVKKTLETNDNQAGRARKYIGDYFSELVEVLYERTDKMIPRKSFEAYLKLILDKTDEELLDYEELAFNYEGYVISPEMRIYDALNDIINYLHDELGMARGFTPEQLSFFKQVEYEIIGLANAGDIQSARKKLVALQLYLDIGTKFRIELREFLFATLNVGDVLDIDKEKGKGGPTR